MDIVCLVVENTLLKMDQKNYFSTSYYQTFTSNREIFAWKSKGLLEESIKTPATSNNSFALKFRFVYNGKVVAKLKRIFLEYNIFNHSYLLNLFINYKLDTFLRILTTGFTLVIIYLDLII